MTVCDAPPLCGSLGSALTRSCDSCGRTGSGDNQPLKQRWTSWRASPCVHATGKPTSSGEHYEAPRTHVAVNSDAGGWRLPHWTNILFGKRVIDPYGVYPHASRRNHQGQSSALARDATQLHQPPSLLPQIPLSRRRTLKRRLRSMLRTRTSPCPSRPYPLPSSPHPPRLLP